jgi:hypothetical protein
VLIGESAQLRHGFGRVAWSAEYRPAR